LSENHLDLGQLDDSIGFRLRRIQIYLAKTFEAATADFNLRSGLFSSLALISANPGVSQNDVSQALGLDKSVVVQLIDELEKRRFAQRKRSKVDRRKHELFCTAQGEQFLQQLFARLEGAEDQALGELSPSERGLLKALLDRIYDAL